jgi:hypothetical protein
MRKALIAVIVLALVILGAPAFITDPASGSGAQAATFDRVEMMVDPSIQGYGGEMSVTITSYFYGGCCYSLFANDITPALEVPEGLSIKSGPTPEVKGSLTAVAGGEPTIVNFEYVLSCDEQGSYDLSAFVDTSDCGSRDTTYQVHVIKGATITKPEMYPEKPTSDKEISLKFLSSYPVGEVKVVSAKVVFWTSDSDLEPRELSMGDAQSLLHNNASIEVLTQGEMLCDKDELVEEGFNTKIPKISDPYVYYVIEVKDEKDEITRSSVYKLEVEDVGAVQMWNTISVVFLVVTMLILIAILYTGQTILNKRMEGVESEDRFSVLGPVGRKRYLTDKEDDKIQIKPEMNWKYMVAGGLIIIFIFVFIFFIVNGEADTLFKHFLEGK